MKSMKITKDMKIFKNIVFSFNRKKHIWISSLNSYFYFFITINNEPHLATYEDL